MSDNLIMFKIELLEEQLNDISNSGFFTEREIDRSLLPLQLELDILKKGAASEGLLISKKQTNILYCLGRKIKSKISKWVAL